MAAAYIIGIIACMVVEYVFNQPGFAIGIKDYIPGCVAVGFVHAIKGAIFWVCGAIGLLGWNCVYKVFYSLYIFNS